MDFILRNVDAGAIKKIDELAKKKYQSRNEFLKNYIESLAVLGELKKQEDRYTELINKLAIRLEENTEALEKLRGDR